MSNIKTVINEKIDYITDMINSIGDKTSMDIYDMLVSIENDFSIDKLFMNNEDIIGLISEVEEYISEFLLSEEAHHWLKGRLSHNGELTVEKGIFAFSNLKYTDDIYKIDVYQNLHNVDIEDMENRAEEYLKRIRLVLQGILNEG